MQVEVKGATLNCEVAGAGRALALVHGAGDTLRLWDRQVEAFARHYQVVRYDVRGHGKTVVKDGDYSTNACVEDLANLLQALNIAQAAVLGYSMGAGICQGFALAHPESAWALVLSNGGGAPRVMGPEEQRQAEERRRQMVEAMERSGLEGTFQDRLARVFSPGFAERHPEVVAFNRAMYTSHDPQEYLKRMQAGMGGGTPPDVSQIRCPTLLIAGQYDAFSGPEAASATQKAIPGSQAHIFPTGHGSSQELPEAYNALVLGFLGNFGE